MYIVRAGITSISALPQSISSHMSARAICQKCPPGSSPFECGAAQGSEQRQEDAPAYHACMCTHSVRDAPARLRKRLQNRTRSRYIQFWTDDRTMELWFGPTAISTKCGHRPLAAAAIYVPSIAHVVDHFLVLNSQCQVHSLLYAVGSCMLYRNDHSAWHQGRRHYSAACPKVTLQHAGHARNDLIVKQRTHMHCC